MREVIRPVFVVGVNNSGTSILKDVLLQHPELEGPEKEGQLLPGMPDIVGKLRRYEWRLWASSIIKVQGKTLLKRNYLSAEDVVEEDGSQIRRVYSEQITKGKRLLEKSPPILFVPSTFRRCFPTLPLSALFVHQSQR